jgi:uncharacterized iron-regulated membrane protein
LGDEGRALYIVMTPTSLWNSSNQRAPTARSSRLRRILVNIHLCIGLGIAVLIVPISLSGAVLVWHEQIEAFVNPDRYAVTQGAAQPPAALLASARASLGDGFALTAVRMPEGAGQPATVTARELRRGDRGGRPRLVTVYLDPPTARVLATAEFRSSLFGFLHRFHENLTVPEYSGRAVVGWTGVGMLIMALSGIYLWWPRNAGFLRGLRYRRGPAASYNLHHLFGFWISVPLAVVSATGIYLGFPQQGRELLSAVAPMAPSQRGAFNAPLLASPQLDADRAASAAIAGESGAKSVAIFLPTQANGAWRVLVRRSSGEATVMVDDRSGARSTVTPQSGDSIAQWIRWIHEGSHSGLLWRIIVTLCGLLPTVFAVTGTMIWLRSRRARSTDDGLNAAPQLEAAE